MQALNWNQEKKIRSVTSYLTEFKHLFLPPKLKHRLLLKAFCKPLVKTQTL